MLKIQEQDGGELEAFALSAGEEAPFSAVQIEGSKVVLHVDWYDSEIEAHLEGEALVGRWRKTVDDGDSTLDFRAVPVAKQTEVVRFEAPTEPADAFSEESEQFDSSGRWAVTFTDEDGSDPAMAVFEQQGERLTRHVSDTHRRLSLPRRRPFTAVFSGSPPSTVPTPSCSRPACRRIPTAPIGLNGDFWSRDKYHATWTARRMAADEPTPLPDPYTEVGLTNDDGRFHFSFPDLEGNQVSIDDARFEGKVVLVDIFGSWCPNCNDSAPVLADLDRRYRDQGLEVVGLAFEMRDDPERNRELVGKFAQRHGVEFPLLMAGTSTDKELAGETLADLTSVLSYPTKIFIDRSGRVRNIHSGFAGPGTGAYYQKLVEELDTLVVELLAESPP